ncbi:MAG: hypothetical protein C4581_09375 [Nitrospiraceae bacterium]|nr:MAG: hypothetical protein C4581_09375 [Nitrospiraceae bacterium]
MTCIDCHTTQDLHGDGNLYSKKSLAVEIECEDCHGTAAAYSTLTSLWGSPLTNLKKEASGIALASKMHGKEYVVPQTKDTIAKGRKLAQVAMGIASHMEKIEYYGCHAQQDLSKSSADGTTGFSQYLIQPHTVISEARTCEDYYASRKAIRLGNGSYNSRVIGLT